MKGLAETLRDFVSLFDRLGLPYAVMGGLAVRVYGIPRPTYDVDFTVAIARATGGTLPRHQRRGIYRTRAIRIGLDRRSSGHAGRQIAILF